MESVATLITPPADEPVTLVEAKEHLRLEHDVDDTLVGSLISAARQHLELVLWRGFVTQTWELVLDGFPCADRIELPKGNLVSITSVKYIDANGTEQTWAADQYEADAEGEGLGRLRLAYDASWPETRCQWDAVRIRYVVGWEVAAVPTPLKQALLLLVSHFYEQRSPEVTGTIVSPITFAVDALSAPYRLCRY